MGSLLTRAAPRCLAIASRLRSYLQRTKTLALSLRPTNEDFAIYTDSSFAPEGSKSHSGLVAVWLGAPVCWRSARQPFTCLSTAECELLAATEGLVMARSVESVLYQMKKDVGKIYLQVDNQAAVSLCKPSASSSWRTRHLRVRASYIHEQVENDQVAVSFVSGKNQWADLLTKSFPRQRLEELIGIWGFVDMTAGFSKVAMVRALIACMMAQTVRAQEEEEPLALTMSLELYLMIAVFMIAAVAIWEFLWWCVDRCCAEVRPSRAARRLRNLQETIQREIEVQMTQRETTSTTTPSASPTRGATSSPQTPDRSHLATSPLASASSSTTFARRSPTTTMRCKTHEAGVQVDARPLVCYQDREVPVPVPDPSAWTYPLYVSPHGDTYHTFESCWGLRNTRPRAVRFCQCCRENHGRSLRDRG